MTDPSGTVRIASRNPLGNPSGIFSVVLSGASGNGGNIIINAGSIFTDDALLIARNEGNGSGGNISLQVGDAIALTNGSLINSSIFGRGNAGNISIQVGDAIALTDSSFIFTNVELGAIGNGGNITINARNLSLTNGAEINSSTSGNGIAGNIRVNATNSIFLNGVAPTVLQDGRAGGFSSGLFSSSDGAGSGAGGQILVETPNLKILDGAVISATSRSVANAGNITVNSQNVELRGGGQILATAFSGGNAGNIDVTADSITISGTDPTLNTRFNQVAQQFDRDTAEQRIDPVAPESGIFVNSSGTGQGGNLSITGNTLTLDRGILSASTQSVNGGNINLRLQNFLRLRNESLISATSNFNGNGGNITIDAPFIVAFPRNNDIAANAGNGSGGQVLIRTRRLFGITPLSLVDLQKLRPNDLDPRQLPSSDIVSFSALGPQVLLTSPDVDPSRGLVELPETVTDTTQQIAQSPCRQGIGNEFAVTGRGGLPTTPNEILSSNNVRVDLLQPVASSGNSPSATIKPATTVTARRVPAQGWIFNDKGQVVLTAYDPTNAGSQRPFSTTACPAR